MTDPDYRIEEYLDKEEMRVRYRIFKMKGPVGPEYATPKTFDTLEEANDCVRLLRKYAKERIFHYVEDEELKND